MWRSETSRKYEDASMSWNNWTWTQTRTNLLPGEVKLCWVARARRLRDDIRHKCVQLSSGLILPSVCTVHVPSGMERERLRIEYKHTGLAVRAEGFIERVKECDSGSVVVRIRITVDPVLFSCELIFRLKCALTFSSLFSAYRPLKSKANIAPSWTLNSLNHL